MTKPQKKAQFHVGPTEQRRVTPPQRTSQQKHEGAKHTATKLIAIR